MENEPLIQQLKDSIEQMINRKMYTPKDFDFLSEKIFSRLNIMVSATTLKRLWGYLNEGNVPRKSTLSILAQFIGYRDWDSFIEAAGHENADSQSNLILSRRLSSFALMKGDIIQLNWLPNRICKIMYLGNCMYEVINSENAKLQSGDTFHCSIFIEGEPLYIDNLTHGTYQNIAYVAGKKDGIHFELISSEYCPTETFIF